ncbi:hypothetical protein HFO86_14955 [Rhizobium leguminosarum]|uniref:DNA cytosine methyltransferase n=1 Tax=Rhizobium leguminosarum TaxID=384 RepID=UPI001C93F781|nr:DNA cytosine methyltransferase [Rhizobium leguminosarum]MBY5471499.1 hypothetical protein [Rhizobium leguminosarum]
MCPEKVNSRKRKKNTASDADKRVRDLLAEHTRSLFALADAVAGTDARRSRHLPLQKSMGMPSEIIEAVSGLRKIPTAHRKLFEQGGVTLNALQAYLRAGVQARLQSLRHLASHSMLEVKDIEFFILDEEARRTGRASVSSAQAGKRIQSGFDSKAKATRDGVTLSATSLYGLMLEFEKLPVEKRPRLREPIIQSAATAKKYFDAAFKNAAKPMEDWLILGRKDQLAQHLTGAAYALELLSEGRFGSKLPSVGPYNFFRSLPIGSWHSIPTWTALHSIRCLAGAAPANGTRRTYGVRPISRPTAIDLSVGIGGQALGIASAGFIIKAVFDSDPKAISIVHKNSTNWNAAALDIVTQRAQVISAIELSLTTKDGEKSGLDVLTGSFRERQRFTRSTGHQPSEMFDAASVIVERFRPKAFFFETSKKVLSDSHPMNRIIGTYNALGYNVQIFEPKLTDFGIPQDRDDESGPGTSYLVGIVRDLAPALQLPVIRRPKLKAIADIIDYAAFPYRTRKPGLLSVEKKQKTITSSQRKYDAWAFERLHAKVEFGETMPSPLRKFVTLPDFADGVNSYVTHNKMAGEVPKANQDEAIEEADAPVEDVPIKRGRGRPKKLIPNRELKIPLYIERRWSKRGFDITARAGNVPEVGDGLPDLLPLTPQILKALRGIPSYWNMDIESYELHEQIEHLCEAAPPVVALAIARSIQAALTGDVVDLDAQNALEINPAWIRPGPRVESAADPGALVAELWKKGFRSLSLPPKPPGPPTIYGPDEDD